MEHREKIRQFITGNLDVFEEEGHFTDSDNIFELGVVNSLFAMRILKFVETEFQIQMQEEDMEIENFSSVDNIVKFIREKGVALPAY
jgi:methoxymalonate biosynthesis acyl carrier protein